MNVAQNVKNKRIELGITQEKLAEKVHVGKSMICQIERGTRVLTLPLAKELADIFNCQLEDLIK